MLESRAGGLDSRRCVLKTGWGVLESGAGGLESGTGVLQIRRGEVGNDAGMLKSPTV